MKDRNNRTAPSDAACLRQVKRGEIYNIGQGLNIPTGTEIWPNRPGIIISNEAINEKSGFVTIVYLTTSPKRDMPYHVAVQSGKKMATALCEQIFSVDKSRLGDLIGTATQEEMDNVDVALQLSLSTIGVNKAKCLTLLRKWLLALEKHGISLMGNPAESDAANASDIARLEAERDMYKGMYQQQAITTQRLLASQ